MGSLHADRFRHEWDEAMTTQMTEGEFALMVRDGFTPYWRKFLTNSLFDPADDDKKFTAKEMLSKCMKKETNLVTERNVKARAGRNGRPDAMRSIVGHGYANGERSLATVTRGRHDEATDFAMTTATSEDQSGPYRSPWDHVDVKIVKECADGLSDRESPLAKWFANPTRQGAECYKRVPPSQHRCGHRGGLPAYLCLKHRPGSGLVGLSALDPADRKSRIIRVLRDAGRNAGGKVTEPRRRVRFASPPGGRGRARRGRPRPRGRGGGRGGHHRRHASHRGSNSGTNYRANLANAEPISFSAPEGQVALCSVARV